MTNGLKLFASIIVLVVIISVVGAFIVIGSPAKERLRKFDQERVSNLNTIENAMNGYFEDMETFPDMLTEVRDRVYYDTDLIDPETQQAYSYEKLTEHSYQICATFALPSSEVASYRPSIPSKYPMYLSREGQFDDHAGGEQCFMREVDLLKFEDFKEDNNLIDRRYDSTVVY